MRFQACSSISHWFQRGYVSSVVENDQRERTSSLGCILQIYARDSSDRSERPSPLAVEILHHNTHMRRQRQGELEMSGKLLGHPQGRHRTMNDVAGGENFGVAQLRSYS